MEWDAGYCCTHRFLVCRLVARVAIGLFTGLACPGFYVRKKIFVCVGYGLFGCEWAFGREKACKTGIAKGLVCRKCIVTRYLGWRLFD